MYINKTYVYVMGAFNALICYVYAPLMMSVPGLPRLWPLPPSTIPPLPLQVLQTKASRRDKHCLMGPLRMPYVSTRATAATSSPTTTWPWPHPSLFIHPNVYGDCVCSAPDALCLRSCLQYPGYRGYLLTNNYVATTPTVYHH